MLFHQRADLINFLICTCNLALCFSLQNLKIYKQVSKVNVKETISLELIEVKTSNACKRFFGT